MIKNNLVLIVLSISFIGYSQEPGLDHDFKGTYEIFAKLVEIELLVYDTIPYNGTIVFKDSILELPETSIVIYRMIRLEDMGTGDIFEDYDSSKSDPRYERIGFSYYPSSNISRIKITKMKMIYFEGEEREFEITEFDYLLRKK